MINITKLFIVSIIIIPSMVYASTYDRAFKVLLKYEGIAYHNNPNDPGGPTKFGWTLKSYQQTVSSSATRETIKAMTRKHAKELYKTYWWDKYGANKIRSKKLAIQLFIAQVNMGPTRPNKVLQEMINDICDTKISMDGIIGNQTAAFTHKCKRLSVGYPYYLHLTYKNDPKVAPVWAWAKKGLRNRIFHFID